MKTSKMQRLDQLCDVIAEIKGYERGSHEDTEFIYEIGAADMLSKDKMTAEIQYGRIKSYFEIYESACEMLILWYLLDTLPAEDNVPF